MIDSISRKKLNWVFASSYEYHSHVSFSRHMIMEVEKKYIKMYDLMGK
jgi:hypothetical protein